MNILHIARREVGSTFSSAVGWLVLCGWLLITGAFWIVAVMSYVVQSQDLVFNPYAASELTFVNYLFPAYFGNCAVVLVIVTPAISMRLFSEEVKQRTLELLLTSPVSTLEIVLGKYLGALAVLGLMLLGTLHGPLGLFLWADVDPGPLFGSYLALGLLGAALLAMGMFGSACTPNQVVAMVFTVAVALGLLILQFASSTPGDWLDQLSLIGHMPDLMRGAIKLSDIVYYLAFTGLFLFATHQRMETFRWR